MNIPVTIRAVGRGKIVAQENEQFIFEIPRLDLLTHVLTFYVGSVEFFCFDLAI
jgi:hypothetical protein